MTRDEIRAFADQLAGESGVHQLTCLARVMGYAVPDGLTVHQVQRIAGAVSAWYDGRRPLPPAGAAIISMATRYPAVLAACRLEACTGSDAVQRD